MFIRMHTCLIKIDNICLDPNIEMLSVNGPRQMRRHANKIYDLISTVLDTSMRFEVLFVQFGL